MNVVTLPVTNVRKLVITRNSSVEGLGNAGLPGAGQCAQTSNANGNCKTGERVKGEG